MVNSGWRGRAVTIGRAGQVRGSMNRNDVLLVGILAVLIVMISFS